MTKTFSYPGPQALAEVTAFYDRLIDGMADAKYHPGWEKGVYPTEEFLASSLEKGELALLRLDGVLAGAMVVNHSCTEGYETMDWAVSASPEEGAVIHALGVSPDFQGQGLASAMVQEAVRRARETGCRALRLDVLAGNLPAQRLYTAAGFQYRGTVKLFYEDTGLTDFLLYERVL